MSIKILDPRMESIVAMGAQRQTISDQFNFTEGPIWDPRAGHLTFSDIPENRLYRWREGTAVTIYREPSNMANGNTMDAHGRILTCEHATSCVVREKSDGSGTTEVLASHYQGKELNSPNDIIVGRDGNIYFTDPEYGRTGTHGVLREPELDFRGVYRIDRSGDLHLLESDFEQPNGLCFGLTEDVLFVADTPARHIRRFHLNDHQLSGGEVFCASPAPDGLKIDSLGNLYAGGPGGVHVYDGQDGTHLGTFETPAFCANFTWGGPDLRTLFMTASTTVFAIQVQVPGTPLY